MIRLRLLVSHAQSFALLDATEPISAPFASAITELLTPSRNSVVVILEVVLSARTWIQRLTADVLLSESSALTFTLFFAGVAIGVTTTAGIREGGAALAIDVVEVGGNGVIAGTDVVGEVADLLAGSWRHLRDGLRFWLRWC